MSLVSIQFLLFLIILIIVYFIVPKRLQWWVLLAANVVFYAFSGVSYLAYILITSAAAFIAGMALEKTSLQGQQLVAEAADSDRKKSVKAAITSRKKLIVAGAVVISMGIWGVLKYANFFIDNINSVGRLFGGAGNLEPVNLILPLGISFYTFNAVGYLIDIYRNKYRCERNFLKFFTYISFFPHIIEGPFSRYDRLSSNLFSGHRFSFDRLRYGALRVCWGYFEKTIIADKVGVTVETVFNNFRGYSGLNIAFAMVMYCIQLYADFQGYMDIVCGICEILGIELDENFRQPYFARSIDEFWRRWHLTLGTWFKDYIFYPVSMSRAGQKMGRAARKKWGAKMGKLVPGYFAMIFVWTTTGLWHGASWTYVIWGWLNMIAILSTMQFQDSYNKAKARLGIKTEGWAWQGILIIKTFCLVCLFRFFSYSGDLSAAVNIIGHTFSHFFTNLPGNLSGLFAGMEWKNIIAACAGILMLFVLDVIKEKGKWQEVREKCPLIVRDIIWIVLIVSLILLAGNQSDLQGGFMYAIY
ncbi:MAG: MBOAT family protein [Parasporobacterium sp.]|nr:MBOAT family protein [Parasporobacterium sp.]